MKLNLTNLNEWLSVGEVVKVRDDLRENRTEGFLEGVDGVEVKMADGEIRSRCVGHQARQALVDRGFTQRGADELMHERDMFLAIVGDVEVIVGFVGIKDGDFDHGASGMKVFAAFGVD